MLKRIDFIGITILVIIFCLASQSNAQVKEKTSETNSPVNIANSEQFSLFSSNTQQEYKIYIHLPSSYSRSDTIYPVIYGLDADIGFGMSSEMSTLLAFRNEMPEVIIVGIAYGAYPGQEGNNRIRDYTPTVVEEYDTSGAAENFLRFIRDELIPVIDSKYRTNPIDRTLSGASLSGLFSLYVLFEHPGIFNRYKISSPSLWWDNGVTFKIEKKYSEKYSDLPAIVFLSVGDDEPTTESWKKLIQVLEYRNYKSLKLTTMMFDDAPHLTACILAAVRGIKAVFLDE
ncbi:MAG: alpha/beta hydrolase-fold protein [Ignavibacteriaceae bacterium]